MFSELPKLFDRNFAIAFFLPVTLFILASAWMLYLFSFWPTFEALFTGDKVFDVTVLILAAWMAAILLLVLNREIYRILEGYGEGWNPVRMALDNAKATFRSKFERMKWLNQHYDELTPEQKVERAQLMKELAVSYPDQERFVLPTAFGNTLRSFEVYSRVMYGLEGIDGWPRILAVLPKDYRELIDDAKAQVDWWVNLSVMSLLLLIEFWMFMWKLTPDWYFTSLNIVISLGCFVLINWVFYWRATSAAMGWGDYVKTAFDIYRFDLLAKLGIDKPKDRDLEKQLWTSFSQAIIFRQPDYLPNLKVDDASKTNQEDSVANRVQPGLVHGLAGLLLVLLGGYWWITRKRK